MKDKLIVAFASDDKKTFTNKHFGEAKEYLIYEISKADSKLIETIANLSPEEKMHGDPNKAKGVASLLKPFGVKVLISKAFGRNIVRQQQKFVVILSNTEYVGEAIKNIQNNFNDIVFEWQKGETRNYLRF
jgi:predicted Fe-Mo cluster-binding NifX family protein